MAPLLVALIAVNIVLFGTLAVWAIRQARRVTSSRLRSVTLVVAVASAAFVLGAALRLAFQAARAGWLSAALFDDLATWWQLLQSLAGTALGVWALVVARRAWSQIERTDRMVTVMTDRLAFDMSVSDLGLTARELEVLETLASGVLSDREIAEALYISPATAATHVRNILRKAGLNNRRDLMLLSADGPPDGRLPPRR